MVKCDGMKASKTKIFVIISIVVLSLILPARAAEKTSEDLPEKVFLPIPFICQAPYGNWGQPWQDACEEAAIIMAMRYIKGEPLSKTLGNQEILDLVDSQIKKYGGHYDLNAEQIAKLIADYYNFRKIEVRYDIKVEDIKRELASGHAVIAPMAGRLLGNPYYTALGPVYHNILFKGYNDQTGEFITNDAGTKRGNNYRYEYRVAFAAIHDWMGNKNTIRQGKKVMIVILK